MNKNPGKLISKKAKSLGINITYVRKCKSSRTKKLINKRKYKSKETLKGEINRKLKKVKMTRKFGNCTPTNLVIGDHKNINNLQKINIKTFEKAINDMYPSTNKYNNYMANLLLNNNINLNNLNENSIKDDLEFVHDKKYMLDDTITQYGYALIFKMLKIICENLSSKNNIKDQIKKLHDDYITKNIIKFPDD